MFSSTSPYVIEAQMAPETRMDPNYWLNCIVSQGAIQSRQATLPSMLDDGSDFCDRIETDGYESDSHESDSYESDGFDDATSMVEKMSQLKICKTIPKKNLIKRDGSSQSGSHSKNTPPVNAIDKGGNTLLHLAVICRSSGFSTLVPLFKQCINKTNEQQQTPLHLAILKNKMEALRCILIHGGDYTIRDRSGNSCLHLLAKNEQREAMTQLFFNSIPDIRKDAINKLNNEGFAPLHIAILEDNEACARLLIQKTCDVNVKAGKTQQTSLHLAVLEQNYSLVTLLLSQREVLVDSEDLMGNTPLHVAVTLRSSRLVRQLIEAGASVDHENMHSETPASLAEDFTEILSIILSVERDASPEPQKASVLFLDASTENELCKLLDPPSNGWKQLGIYMTEESVLDSLEKLKDPSPTRTLLVNFQKNEMKYIDASKSLCINILRNSLVQKLRLCGLNDAKALVEAVRME